MIYKRAVIPSHTSIAGFNLSPLDKKAASFADDISLTFSSMKSFVFRFEFHWILFLGDQLAIGQHRIR